jgi:thioesterase domain-containing protein
VRRGHKTIADESLVPIQPNGTRLPFFCVIPPGGDAVEMVQLANLLGQDQPFYGLQRHRLHVQDQQQTTDPNNSANPYIAARRFRQAGWQEDESLGNVSGVERMAAYYLRVMREVQPRGPYTLGGRCFGGMVAMEMAHQLVAQGEQVALLALFGSTPPGYHAPTKHVLDRLAFHGKRGNLLSVLFFYLKVKLARIPRDLKRRRLIRARERELKRAAQSAEPDKQSSDGHMPRYVPRAYAGRLTIFDTTRDTQDLWGEWAEEGVDHHVIDGTHHDVFYEPGVYDFAKQLAGCLEQAQQRAMAAL